MIWRHVIPPGRVRLLLLWVPAVWKITDLVANLAVKRRSHLPLRGRPAPEAAEGGPPHRVLRLPDPHRPERRGGHPDPEHRGGRHLVPQRPGHHFSWRTVTWGGGPVGQAAFSYQPQSRLGGATLTAAKAAPTPP